MFFTINIKVDAPVDAQAYLHRIADMFKDVMQDNLVGIYLHGSLAMNCFNSTQSDIDLLIIANHSLRSEEKKEIAKQLLLFEEECSGRRGVELSIVLETYLEQFVYPTPFEFHYSDFHRERYRNDENYICGGFEDPDLAAHFTVTYHRGVTIHGKPIRTIFKPVDNQYYLQSIVSDVDGASRGIIDSPVYFTLNLSRVLMFLREGTVSSKREGGEWALKVLPPAFHDVIRQCLDQYSGEVKQLALEPERLVRFSDDMLNLIRHAMNGTDENPS